MDKSTPVSGAKPMPTSMFKQAVGRYLLRTGAVAFTATIIALKVPYMLIPAGAVDFVAIAIFCKAAYTAMQVRKSDGKDPAGEAHSTDLRKFYKEAGSDYNEKYVIRSPDEVRRDQFIDTMKASYGMLLVRNIQNLFAGLNEH